MTEPTAEWIIVSGLSGSGKSNALHTLEDLGYYCIDNLPLVALDEVVSHLRENVHRFPRVALGLDIRSGRADVVHMAMDLRETLPGARLIFLTADEPVLIRRYSETRRRHPLAAGEKAIGGAIAEERQLMAPVAERADVIIDTSNTSVHQLRRAIYDAVGAGDTPTVLLLESFAYKEGVPSDLDFAFDMRCLPNPHWVPELRELTGSNAAVARWLGEHEVVREMVSEITGFLERWLPRFEEDGRHYLTVGIGCTGGKHRSVYVTEQVAAHFRAQRENVIFFHRELI